MNAALAIVFAVSGLCGLIYESIWSHYLKLFLGHAAYAQTLVLIIFMGGMALGSWLAARCSPRWRNLLLAYAVVEGVIGVAGMAFHAVFRASVGWTLATALPAIGDPGAAHVFQWTVAAVLVAPQSVLLGMTFPLMSGALVRRSPQAAGSSLAVLYFANSIGGAVGVLLSGFALIPAVGLPGTIMTAGILNVLLACGVWLLARGRDWPAPPAAGQGGVAGTGATLLLGAAFVTGAASFLYEIGWIRMLSLVLGASTHAFELMLSAFILGLALGSLWIRARIDAIRSPVAWLAAVQALMGVLALASLLVYGHMFEVMSSLLRALDTTAEGYTLFNVASHAIALAVMLPATFCAGMTLPLITLMLMRTGQGERAIGGVYAANTAGAIVGVIVAVHLLMPGVGLAGLLCAGAGLDIALAGLLVWRMPRTRRPRRLAAVPAAALVALVLAVAFVRLDPRAMASGVYRYERPRTTEGAQVVYQADGKTATVNLIQYEVGVLAITTNGKPDAAIMMRPGAEPTTDEYTMTLAAALPLAMDAGARDVAVIGFGSGMTTHTLLTSARVRRVDTIEIEPRMLEAARRFRPVVERAFADERSHVHIDDARTFFSLSRDRYDILISEPSNPWVSGVSSLYTGEFYRIARGKLAEGGVFAQWIHMLELNETLLACVVKALSEAFPHYALYTMNDRDLLIVAGARPDLIPDPQLLFEDPGLAAVLARLDIRQPRDVESMFLGDDASLGGLFAASPVPGNSDYFPLLDLGAVRARYLGESATGVLDLARGPLPVVEMLAHRPPPPANGPVGPRPHVGRARDLRAALAVRDWFAAGREPPLPALAPELRTAMLLLRPEAERCDAATPSAPWRDAALTLLGATAPFLAPRELDGVLAAVAGCEALRDDVDRRWIALLRAVAARDAPGMARIASGLLAVPGAVRNDGEVGYLLSAAMLGHLAMGDTMTAGALWDTHAGRVLAPGTRPVLSLRLLQALSHPPADPPAR